MTEELRSRFIRTKQGTARLGPDPDPLIRQGRAHYHPRELWGGPTMQRPACFPGLSSDRVVPTTTPVAVAGPTM